ncbi:tryptophan synthase subunit beta [bacterium]|nr:tryptophan synthase subunit beta [bacterium]
MGFGKINIMPDSEGFYGNYGGQFVPNELKKEFQKIAETFLNCIKEKEFNDELNDLLENYAGRPSPVYYAKNLSAKYNCGIYLKREDLNHTGAHKINHSLGEALLAKRMGKSKLIAETGAGQHGVAIATAAAITGLECDIYMGEIDIVKEKPNVERMKILGANIVPVSDGTKTLKEAVDASFNAYLKEYNTAMYAIGSAVGPYPFPMIIEYFQSVIGREAREQFLKQAGKLPDCIIACVGGGSNAIGLFSGFIEDESVDIYGVEPLGRSSAAGDNAASMNFGKDGIIHGFKCKVLQDADGKITNAYSVASGLDYPGVGPKHCYLAEIGRVKYDVIDDNEAINAFYELSKAEGIIPALESSHAVAYGLKLAKTGKYKDMLINLSGRGDKDIEFVLSKFNC